MGTFLGLVDDPTTASEPSSTSRSSGGLTSSEPSASRSSEPTGSSSRRPMTTASSLSRAPSYISCSTQNQQPGQGITAGYCVCSGSTFPQSTTTSPPNSCAYTTLPGPSATTSISRLRTGPTRRPTSTRRPEPEPEPTSPTHVFVTLALQRTIRQGIQMFYHWSWIGMSLDARVRESDYCDKDEYPRAIIDTVGSRQPPRFTESLGSFDLVGHDDCTYTGPTYEDGRPVHHENDGGSIRCADGYSTICWAYQSEDALIFPCGPAPMNPSEEISLGSAYCYYEEGERGYDYDDVFGPY